MPRCELALRPIVPIDLAAESFQAGEKEMLEANAFRAYIVQRIARQAEIMAATRAMRQAIAKLVPSRRLSLWSARLRFL